MKRLAPFLACLAGLAGLMLLVPRFNSSQPHGISITRAQAKAIADAEARRAGIPIDKAWSTLSWSGSRPLDQELDKNPEMRRRAAEDPVIGPRLGGYRAVYYRRGLEKFFPYGDVIVSERTGEILTRRLRFRNEEPGARLEEDEIRRRGDAFVQSRSFPGAPSPQFEDARPTRHRNRTDWILRYRVQAELPTGPVVPYLWIYFTGDTMTGWALIEEYADGRTFRGDNAGEIAGTFMRYGVMYTLLLVLLGLFLKKYHAGEVGVGTASLLFFALLALAIIFNILIGPARAEGTGFGSLDAQSTAWSVAAFTILFFELPAAVLAFFAWAVGESYARERWGERLASFDALLRRDAFNATVGRSTLRGLLTAPAVAAGAFLIGFIALQTGVTHPAFGNGTFILARLGGPWALLVATVNEAIGFAVIGILFVLAAAFRRRVFAAGIVVALIFGAISTIAAPPMEPFLPSLLFGWGAAAVAIVVFLAYDLLAATVGLFVGALLVYALPLLSVARGDFLQHSSLILGVPIAVGFAFAIAALLTKREVVYTYDELAPHVRRIIERERVKAEIDAANRIQAALLPASSPNLTGASVASHYRAATEIGGDYFDFLPQSNGNIGIAFGDVSGHGLSSGIVMAMAKSALLVQLNTDASPRAVMQVLNDIVIRTAPRRILMTFFFGLLDPRAHTLRFSSAGHLDPYVYRAGSGQLEALSSWGFPLGVRRREQFREHTVQFAAGDRLILYSDGLIEALDDDGEPFGFERFEQTLVQNGHLSADEIKRNLLSAVKKYTRNRPPEDDQTLVVVSFDEPAADYATREAAVSAAYSVN